MASLREAARLIIPLHVSDKTHFVLADIHRRPGGRSFVNYYDSLEADYATARSNVEAVMK